MFKEENWKVHQLVFFHGQNRQKSKTGNLRGNRKDRQNIDSFSYMSSSLSDLVNMLLDNPHTQKL